MKIFIKNNIKTKNLKKMFFHLKIIVLNNNNYEIFKKKHVI